MRFQYFLHQAYTRDERLDFRRHIHQNMIETVWKLCGYIREHRPGDAVVQTAAFQRMLPPPEDAVGHQGRWMPYDYTHNTWIIPRVGV